MFCGWYQDIIHCHDWSSAPVAWLFKEQYMHYGLTKARIVFTIHNLEFGAQMIGKAMAFSDKATTVSYLKSFYVAHLISLIWWINLVIELYIFVQVSPTYSQEVSGHPSIAPHLFKFHGILNGIDPDIWDPYNDKFIPVSKLHLSTHL